MAIHFGVTLPQIKRTWDETRAAALEFEALGYDSVWLNDHLYGIPGPQIPILEAWTTLSAVGAVTSRVQLGTLVSPVGFRNPALLAKMAATLDNITGGRVIVGLGGGWFEMEFSGYGFDFPPLQARLQQLDEAAALDEAHVDRGAADASRASTSTPTSVYCEPKPVRKPHPPILIGGGGEQVLLRMVARHADIWNNLAVQSGAAGAQGRACCASTAQPSAATRSRSRSRSKPWSSSARTRRRAGEGGEGAGHLRRAPRPGHRRHAAAVHRQDPRTHRRRLHDVRHRVLRPRHPRAGATVCRDGDAGVQNEVALPTASRCSPVVLAVLAAWRCGGRSVDLGRRQTLDAALAQQGVVPFLVGRHRRRITHPHFEQQSSGVTGDQRAKRRSDFEDDECARRTLPVTDQQVALEYVHEVIALVAVPLDHHLRVVPTEHDHLLRRPLEKLLMDRDALAPVHLRDDLSPLNLVDVHERQAGALLAWVGVTHTPLLSVCLHSVKRGDACKNLWTKGASCGTLRRSKLSQGARMKGKRVVAILALVSMLALNAVRPRAARANDTAIIVVASIAAYVAFVAIGATLAYGRGARIAPAFAPGPPPAEQRPQNDRLRVGPACAPDANGNVTLICW